MTDSLHFINVDYYLTTKATVIAVSNTPKSALKNEKLYYIVDLLEDFVFYIPQ